MKKKMIRTGCLWLLSMLLVLETWTGSGMLLAQAANALNSNAASQEKLPTWAGKEIQSLKEAGVMKGYPDGTIRPHQSITRAELVTLLYKIRPSSNQSASTTTSFKDITNQWYGADVIRAAKEGMVNGYPDGTFRPDQPVNRYEVAKILQLAFAPAAQSGHAATNYSDQKQIPHWAVESISVISAAGWMKGYPDGTFGGLRTLTRAEGAVLLHRAWLAEVGEGSNGNEAEGTEGSTPGEETPGKGNHENSSPGTPGNGGGPVTSPGDGGPVSPPVNPPKPEEPPGGEKIAAPVGLLATAGNGQVTLRWEQGGTVIPAGYKVYYAEGNSDWNSSAQDTGKEKSHTITGLTNGQTYRFAVSAYDASGVETKRSAEVYAVPQKASDPSLPPDPQETSTPLPATNRIPFSESIEFLYAGERPIQIGVEEGAIDAERVAVVRGNVLDAEGNPLSGVNVSVSNQSQYGHTISRADGQFDLAVNGFGAIVIDYEKEGYMPIQRKAQPSGGDFTILDDVVLLPYDDQVTKVKLGENVSDTQVAQGSPVTDADGSRQATLIIHGGTSGSILLPDGTEQPMAELNIRATEYTVGERGPEAMPGELPSLVGYTYAVELSADEAVSAGATEVRFDQPLYLYVDNFLEFPVGGTVPIGYYDRSVGAWIPSENGRIIEVLSVNNGLASVDIDGDGAADNENALAAIGLTKEERRELAALYKPGQSFWRSPIEHFTPWDCNWPYGPPLDAESPPDRKPNEDKPDINDPCKGSGSIIGCQTQTLSQVIPVTGTGLSMVYDSQREPGYISGKQLETKLTGEVVSPSITYIEVELQIAGRRIVEKLEPKPNLIYRYEWDGKDVYGRSWYGNAEYQLMVSNHYPMVYLEPSTDFPRSFGRMSNQGGTFTTNRTNMTTSLSRNYEGILDSPLNEYQEAGLGGWSLNIHHGSDGENLFLGAGGEQVVTNPYRNKVTQTLNNYDYAQSKSDQLTVTPDGTVHMIILDDTMNGTVHQYSLISEDRKGQRTKSELPHQNPTMLRSSPTGELYFISSNYTDSIMWKRGADGIWQRLFTFDQQKRDFKNGDSFEQFPIEYLTNFEVDREGNIFFLQREILYRSSPDGIVEILSEYIPGGDTTEYPGPVSPGRIGRIAYFQLGSDGTLYLMDRSDDFSHYRSRIRKVTPQGQVEIIVHSRPYDQPDRPLYNGAYIIEEPTFAFEHNFKLDGNGNMYLLNRLKGGSIHDLYRLTPSGRFELVKQDMIGYKYFPLAAVSPDGDPYYIHVEGGDSENSFRSYTKRTSRTDGITAPDAGGRLVYEMQPDTFQHVKTLDALSGTTLYRFDYDDEARLTGVIDRNNNKVLIERGVDGSPTAIMSPGGQRTQLVMDDEGRIATVTNPAGESYAITYDAGGLMTSFTEPGKPQKNYGYDQDTGYLVRAEQANEGVKTLTRTPIESGYKVEIKDAMDRVTTLRVQNKRDHIRRETVTPSGASTVSKRYADGHTVTEHADGTIIRTWKHPDPIWEMQAAYIGEMKIELPSGKSNTYRQSRKVTLEDPSDPFSLMEWTESHDINGVIKTRSYNSNTRTYTESDQDGTLVQTVMNDRDYVERIIRMDENVDPIQYTYDERGNVAGMTQGDQWITQSYDEFNRLVATEDASGSRKTFRYDDANRLIGVQQPGGNEYTQMYDEAGNKTGVTLPNGASYTMAYNELDELERFLPAGENVGLQRTFNVAGDLTGVIQPGGREVTYGYDQGGRMESMNDSDIQRSFTYADQTDRVTKASASSDDWNQNSTYSYDGSNVISELVSGSVNATHRYTYDNSSRLTEMVTNVGGEKLSTLMNWGNNGLLERLGNFRFERNVGSQQVSALVDNQLRVEKEYNSQGSLKELRYVRNVVIPSVTDSVYSGPETLYTIGYNYDNRGWVTRKTINTGATGQVETYDYTHDSNGQLTQVIHTDAEGEQHVEQYEYDTNRNRIFSKVDTEEIRAIYNERDQLLESGSVTYKYDADGYLSERGQDTFKYGTRGELLSAVVNGSTVSYAYDYTGRRILRTAEDGQTQYMYGNPTNPLLMTASVDPQGVVSAYEYDDQGMLLAIKRANHRYHVVTDAVGTPVIVLDDNGQPVKELQYDSYGVRLRDSNPEWKLVIGYAGGLEDDTTGLVRFGQRDYDAAAGRWTAMDPILFQGGQGNLYNYVNNSPILMRDPCGLFCIGASAYAGVGGGAQICVTSEGMSICGELGFGAGGGLEISPFGDLQPDHASVKATGSTKAGPVGLELGLEISNLDSECGNLVSPVANLSVGPVSIDLTDPIGGSSVGGDFNELGSKLSDLWRDSSNTIGAKTELSIRGQVCGGMLW
ncbi:S-layer homology domain-containing protein [Paenibacillus sp. QZ-Y1]|uniref:S-layer homology domain-containing protein n=1 Tax=Paenibacillus sp. QZ-Y1 TaxID=3414511 RepID=UPI003F7A4526